MAKKEAITIDDSMEEVLLEQPSKEAVEQKIEPIKKHKKEEQNSDVINCLRNERIIIRHIPRQSRMVTDPKHILYGGMAETATRTFVVPKLTSGRYVNVLTNDEKDFLEDIMNLEVNALSIYRKNDNFWSDSNPNGISRVILKKQDNFLDLSIPEDYIKYKILLANKDFIAPSMKDLEDHPKATYQFVIIKDDDVIKSAKQSMSTTMKCYTLYGKYEDNFDVLKAVIETVTGVGVSSTSKIEFLQAKVNDLIKSNPKLFLKVIEDPLLTTKVFIKKCVSEGFITIRGDQYYIREGNIPMCDKGDATLSVAAQWLNVPKHQEVKFALEAKLNQ